MFTLSADTLTTNVGIPSLVAHTNNSGTWHKHKFVKNIVYELCFISSRKSFITFLRKKNLMFNYCYSMHSKTEKGANRKCQFVQFEKYHFFLLISMHLIIINCILFSRSLFRFLSFLLLIFRMSAFLCEELIRITI